MSIPHGTSRRNLFKLAGSFGAAAALVTTLSACTPADTTGEGSTSPKPTEGESTPTGGGEATGEGTITAGISYELGTNGYDPMTTTSALTVAANWHTMEGLTEIHPATREVFPALAAEMPNQVDDTTWEVKLRDGAKFSDGSDVTTDDVVFSFERVLDPANASLYAGFLPFMDSVTAKDDTTVTIKTKYAFSLVPARLSVVKIVPKAAATDVKKFDLNPIGSGPYKMTDNGAGSQQVAFEANEHYNGPHPARAKNMVWQILPDASTRTNAISSGTVQAIDSVPAADLTTLAQSKSVAAEQGFGLVFIMFNMGSESMKDVKNRQGVMYALDYKQMTEVGMSDLATPATSFLQKEHPAYQEASTVYTHDLEKAKGLFAETGLTKVKLLCTNHDFFAGVRPIIKQSLEAAGLTVDYDEKQSSDVYNTIDSDPNAYEVMVAPGDPSVFGDDADLLLRWWYGSDVWTDTRMHWKGQESEAKMKELLDAGVAASGDEQKKIWGEAFNLAAETIPMYPLFHRKTPTAFDAESLQDFKPIAVTGLSFVGVGTSK